MADGCELAFPGLSDMLAEMNELPKVIRERVLKGMVATGASVVRQEAVRLAPISTGPISEGHPPPGTLKRAIYQTRLTEMCSPTEEVWKVDVRRGKRARATKRGRATVNLDAYYASWVEYGHFTRVPHEMTKLAKAAGRALGVAHYVAPIPFMRPAAAKIPEALEAMRDYLARNLATATAAMQYIRAMSAA